VKETTTALDTYHSTVLKEMYPTVPTYFIRYEDLRMEPERVLSELFCFILDLKSIEGLNIQRRIQNIISLGHSATVTYSQKVQSADKLDIKIGENLPILFNRSIIQLTDA
jgi:hypothetical protein